MLTSEQDTTGSSGASRSTAGDARRGPRRLRLAAVLLGGLGTLLALLFPLLPVQQDTATITWPSATTGTAPVDAPLVAFRPEAMSVSIPCQAVRDLDERSPTRATIFSTTPPLSPNGPQVGMALAVDDGQILLTNRGQQLAAEPLGVSPCAITITSDAGLTTVDLGNGQQLPFVDDIRPQVVGIYSDLDESLDATAGTSVSITPDTRFQTSPSDLKIAAGVLAVLCFVGGVWALHALDVRAGRKAPRLAPRRWWVPTGRDGVVVAALGTWAVIGSQTSDDGYIQGIARARESAGYIGNYYRWFNVPEAPFGWFYELYAVWMQVSDSVLWMRLPSVIMGIVSWLLISREVLPRLGQQVRRSAAAGWAAAMVFLAFWLPYNNGLRPEPVVVISALLALCAVERGVATRRLAPVALGLFAAAFAVAATPTGLIAVAPFLAAARPLSRLVAERVRTAGWLPMLAPLSASGLVVLVVVFADQTWAAVYEATLIRNAIGPSLSWFEEVVRYQSLFGETADGSLSRRFPVLFLLLALVVCIVVLLRRDRIRGAALGPAQRLIGSSLIGFVVLALTPTKWTHHFGAFAALGAGMAALAALATSADVLRSRRNRSLFLAALFAMLALSFTGANSWWYTNNWGVPWWDIPPSIEGYQASTALLGVTMIFLAIAAIEHLRGLPEDRAPSTEPAWVKHPAIARPRAALAKLRSTGAASSVERRARALRLGSAPIALVCGALVLFQFASMAKSIEEQRGSFTLAGDVLLNPLGDTCGLADQVRVEGSVLAGVLPAAPPPTGLVPSEPGVLPTVAPPVAPGVPTAPLAPDEVTASSPQAQLIDPLPVNVGFRPDGIPPTGGGTGVSGFEYTLRNALAEQALGTFDPEGRATGVLRTDWFTLDDDLRAGRTPLVLSVAGRLGGGNLLTLQYADRLPDESVQILGQDTIDDGLGDEPPWRELRIDLSQGLGAEADEVRLIAQDRSLGPDGWLAIAPMRAPQIVSLTEVYGDGAPGYLEWPVQFASPCLRPFEVRDGIAEVPDYRLIADDSQLRDGAESWSDGSAGGPMGWIDILSRDAELPTFLEGEPNRDWGIVERLDPYAPGTVPPTVERGSETRWGISSPGPVGAPPPGIPSPER